MHGDLAETRGRVELFVVDLRTLERLRSWGVSGCVTTRPGYLAAALA
jgi:hypothetical protein